MNRSLIQVYALAVCFFSLSCLIVALGIGLYDVVQMAVPDFTLQGYPSWETNEQFVYYHPDKKDLPEVEVTVLRKAELAIAVAGERKEALRSAVFVGIIIMIDSVVFAIHWIIAKRNEPCAPGRLAANQTNPAGVQTNSTSDGESTAIPR